MKELIRRIKRNKKRTQYVLGSISLILFLIGLSLIKYFAGDVWNVTVGIFLIIPGLVMIGLGLGSIIFGVYLIEQRYNYAGIAAALVGVIWPLIPYAAIIGFVYIMGPSIGTPFMAYILGNGVAILLPIIIVTSVVVIEYIFKSYY